MQSTHRIWRRRRDDGHFRSVEHSHDHLLSTEERIADEFARA